MCELPFTTAARRATHAAGVTYFTAFSDRWEINGISEAFANDFGRNLAKKSVVKEVIADLYVKTPGWACELRFGNHLRAQ